MAARHLIFNDAKLMKHGELVLEDLQGVLKIDEERGEQEWSGKLSLPGGPYTLKPGNYVLRCEDRFEGNIELLNFEGDFRGSGKSR